MTIREYELKLINSVTKERDKVMEIKSIKYTGIMKFGGNPMMVVEIEEMGDIQTFRQGGIGIWSFQDRSLLNRDQQRQFDKLCNEAWEKLSK